jgi:asparagine synthase (glutamine-hydrolysing)
VAALFETNHRERTVSPRLDELFEQLVVHLDEPFADVSLFPTYMVSRLAREHVKVALSGDGGDELFGGYDAYQAQQLAARFAGVGDALMPAMAAVAAALPPTEQKKGVVNKFKRFVQGAALAPEDLGHYRWMVYLGARAKRRLYGSALQSALAESDVYRPVRDVLARYSGDDLLNRQLYTDLAVYLADDILVKVDRMSMATSLETRAPFLDADVMELAFSMPGDLKIRGGERKWILKRAMRGTLPERVSKRGLFEPAEVTRLVDTHIAGRENHAHTLFPLMVFERWCEEHLP